MNKAKNVAKKFKVIGPKCFGAPYPEFNPAAFNECKIPHNMRYKEYHVDVCVNDAILVEYVTQESFTDEDLNVFVEELKRCFNFVGYDKRWVLRIKTRGTDNEQEIFGYSE